MMLIDLIKKCRSYRRFYQEIPVSLFDMKEMVEHARLSASGRNMQSIKYRLINSINDCNLVFETLSWAGYLKNMTGVPIEGERPSAYIILLNDNELSTNYYCDHGIASQSIMLSAVEKGLGGCIIASVNRDVLRKNLLIPEKYEIIQVLAIGKPKETVVIDEVGADGDIKYWRDEAGVHHVPKRKITDIII